MTCYNLTKGNSTNHPNGERRDFSATKHLFAFSTATSWHLVFIQWRLEFEEKRALSSPSQDKKEHVKSATQSIDPRSTFRFNQMWSWCLCARRCCPCSYLAHLRIHPCRHRYNALHGRRKQFPKTHSMWPCYADASRQIHQGRYIKADTSRQIHQGRCIKADTPWPCSVAMSVV